MLGNKIVWSLGAITAPVIPDEAQRAEIGDPFLRNQIILCGL